SEQGQGRSGDGFPRPHPGLCCSALPWSASPSLPRPSISIPTSLPTTLSTAPSARWGMRPSRLSLWCMSLSALRLRLFLAWLPKPCLKRFCNHLLCSVVLLLSLGDPGGERCFARTRGEGVAACRGALVSTLILLESNFINS